MRKLFQQIIAIALCIAMVSALLPAQQLGLEMAVAKAESAPAVTPDGYADLLDQAAARLEGGERSDGDWRYVLIEEKNVAVVTGYDGTAAEELTVPELLGGADTAGIAAGALSGLKGVKRIGVPMNVVAIGKGALPAGAAVMSNNGVYAAKWARKNGHAFTSTSDYDFVADVVDLTGARPENFNRVSAEEIWLRDLEASQISVGTKFFLLDPDNLYQISYYQATELTAMAGGFVAVSCVTPEVDSILYYYEATDEEMMVDYSTLRLAEDTIVDPDTEKSLSGSISGGLDLKVNLSKSLGDGWSLKGNAGISSTWTASYEVGLFVDDTAKIEQKDKLSGSVTLQYAYSAFDSENFKGERVDLGSQDVMNAIKYAAKNKGSIHGDSVVDVEIPMGSAVVFSIGGILNGAVTMRAKMEATGKVTISFSVSNTTTYNYVNGSMTKTVKKGAKEFNGSVEATLKVGAEVSLELYITAIKVFTVSLFVGLQADVKYDFSQFLNLLGNAIASNFTEGLVFNELFNINMVDCATVDVYILIEVGVKLGAGKYVDIASAKATLLKWKFISLHFHSMPVTFKLENETEGQYTFVVDTYKDNVHIASKCPYDVKTAQFHLDEGDGDKIVRKLINLPIGSTVTKPEIDTIKDYGVKLVGWHTDASLDKDSLVTEWPYEIKDSVDFYADVRKLHKVTFVGANGATLAAEATIKDESAEYSYADREGRAAEGETVVLPDTDSTGKDIKAWVRVTSAADLKPIGDEMKPGDSFAITADSPEEVYLCALTENDIMARFYTGVGNQFQTVYTTRGKALVAPKCEGSIPCRRFAGWEASDGTIVNEGDEIATDSSTPAVLVYTATWEYTGEVTAEDLANITIGTKPSTSSPTKDEEMFTWKEVDGGVQITGFNITDELVPIDVSIPDTIDGKDVVSIANYAFDNTESLRSIIFPNTVETIGTHALQSCASLVFIDLAATQITAVPNYFADGCTSLVGALLPVGQIQSVGNYAFRGCRSFSKVNIDYNVGEYAFSGCTRLSTINIGAGCTSLGANAFNGCTRLTSLVIPDSVTSIGGNFIYGCTKLEELEIQSGIKSLNKLVIGETNSLTKLTLGFGLEKIAEKAVDNNGYGFASLTEVVLPASLKEIGANAFAGAGIETLTVGFANGATTTNSFRGLSKLKTLNVTSGPIGNYCFSGLTALETVNIGEAVTSIGQHAFDGCTALKQISFSEGLLSIGAYAFYNCSSLPSLTIPDSVSSLGKYMLVGCYALEELSVGRVVNTLGTDNDAFNIAKSGSDTTATALKTLTLREGVVNIPTYTFDNDGPGFRALETINLPSSLRTIGQYAFEDAGVKKLVLNGSVELQYRAFIGCDQLEELVVNNGTIGSNAFENNTTLKKVTLNATTVGNYAFSGCTALTDLIIGEGVRTIGEYVFQNCTALTNVDISYGVRTIGSYAFRNCSALTNIVFPDSMTSYGYRILWGCTALKSLTIGGGAAAIENEDFDIGEGSALESIVIREGVATINSGAFDNYGYGFTKLTSVSFPASLQTVNQAFSGSALASVTFKGDVTLNSDAFRGLTNLKSVYMSSGTIGNTAFINCTALTSVYLGDNVTSIGSYAFHGCTALSSVRLGENLTSIGNNAFANCTSLKSLTIPYSVTSMETSALYGCVNLETLSIGAIVDSLGSISFGEGAKLRTLEIRDGATKINSETFDNNDKYLKNLETVILPATLTSIGTNAFQYSGVQRVTIKGQTSISNYAFRHCARLADVSISGGTVGQQAFEGCVSLKNVELFSGTIENWAFNDCISLETLYLGDGVTKIDHHALRNCRSLKAFNIPDSVTYLGNDIIEGCTGIETIVIGGGIGKGLEDGYDYYSPFCVGAPCNLKTLIINEGVTAIPYGTFANYDVEATGYASAHGFDKLETVIIPSTVTYIGGYAFGKSGLRNVIISGAPSIEANAFQDLTNLETVHIAGGKVGVRAFSGCTNLETVVLNEGVTSIGNYAFENCASLRSLHIPDSVTSYGTDMILGCTGLTSLSLGTGVREITSNRFNIGPNSSLKVLEVREGVLRLEDKSFANIVSSVTYGHPELETVILPYTLTYLGKGNLENWPKLKHLHLRYGSALPASDKVSPDLTVYTDYYNYLVDDFALEHDINYVIRDEMDFPEYTLNLVVPSGTVKNTVLEESDGSLVVTQGTDGKTVVLPMGYAVLSKQTLQFTDEFTPDELTVQDGYAFYGWHTDHDYNFKWSGGAMPAANLTLYARVEPLINVRFALSTADAGTADPALPSGWTLYHSYKAENGAAFTLPEDPAVDGWCFTGWYLDESCTMGCNLKKVPAEDLIVYGGMQRVTIGGEYEAVDGGLQLTKYTLEQDESPIVYIPAKVGGVPVVSIAKGAFENSGAKNIVIPSTVTEIEPGALNCSTLVSVSVSSANTAFSADAGVLYNADKTELLYYPMKKSGSSFTVPSGVLKIGGYAFANNATLTRVNFSGSTVTEIGESAFAGMTKLTRMDLPKSVTTMRQNAFQGCTAMEYFTAYGLETIETKTRMDTLPYGTGMWVYGPVGTGALRDYYTVTDSGGKSYTMQYNLYKLSLYVTSWEYMYIEAGQLLPDTLADVRLNNGTVVNEWHVGSTTGELVNLATYAMPAADTNLYAAYTKLFNSTITTVTDINGTSYNGTVISEWNGTDGKVVIPTSYGGNTVRGLAEGFLAISNDFTEITIPNTVISIVDGALDGFTGTIICDSDSYAAQWADENGVDWEPILYTLSFVTKGEDVASMQAGKNTLISLPEAERAGFTFDGWHTNEKATTNVTLTEDGLYTMPGADTTLYAGWIGTEEVVPYTWTSSNKQVTITAYTGTATNVIIPDTINSWPVTAIADSAFAGKNVAQVDLGQVKIIGDSAFEGCEALRTVTMRSVTEIGEDAFAGCLLLRTPILPGTLTAIGESAFEGCEAIGEIVIPDSVTALGDDAFVGCTALKYLTLGAGVKSFSVDMITGCTALKQIAVSAGNTAFKSVGGVLLNADGTKLIAYPAGSTASAYTIPSGVKTIGERAFAGASALTGVTFPDSIVEIGRSAFMGCDIESVELTHVKTIGESAFFGCSALKSADLGDSLTEIGAFAFGSCGSLSDVTIPATAEMDEDTSVFTGNRALLITGVAGSSAQTYAKANGIAFNDPDAVAVTKIVLSAENLTMNRGESTALTATLEPAGAASDITWTSDNSSVVMVDQQGVLRTIAGGSATITARADNGVSASCKITVEAAVTQIIPDIVTPMTVGALTKVGVNFVPANPTNTDLTWTVEDESVATVSADGVIEAIGIGSTNVIVTAANGVSAQIPVTVYTPVETLTLEADSTDMIAVKGLNTLQLKAVVTPDGATFTDCLWTTDNVAYATVTDDGFVTALRLGTVTITATSKDPSRTTASITLTIAAADLAQVAAVEITDARLTDSGYVLEYTVTAGNETLVNNTDFTVTLPEISGTGDYTLTLTGKNRFTGTLEVPFTMKAVTPQIIMDDSKFVWIDELNPVVSVTPETEYSLEYVLIGEDGSRESVGSAPAVSGLYEIIARTEETESRGAAEESVTAWIQVDGGLTVYDSVVLTAGQEGRLPVAMQSEYAPLQSGYRYESSNESVFTVADNGRITAVGKGSATLTVTGMDDSRFTGSCLITVTDLMTMNLPAALGKIEEEAFAGTPAIQQVAVGAQVKHIGSRAFADMNALVQVVIESDDVMIREDAFDGSNPLIVCKAGSAAARFAVANGLRFLAY